MDESRIVRSRAFISRRAAGAALIALVGTTACARMFPEAEYPTPQSSMEAARLAESRQWTSRVITMERDTIVGKVQTADGRIRIAERDLTPGQVYRMERRIGSSHVSRKTVIGMVVGGLAAFVAGELNAKDKTPDSMRAPTFAWAAAGASGGMVISVVAQFGTDESRWLPTWNQ